MRDLRRYLLPLLLWAFVAVYVVWAAASARSARSARRIVRVEAAVRDSSSRGHLVGSDEVRRWILDSGLAAVGMPTADADLSGIEELVERNGFVERAEASIGYDGVLHVELRLRHPVVRLRTAGRDLYVTADGYLFAAPSGSALYAPVVTGSYRPPFPPDYTGSIDDFVAAERRRSAERIAALEREKYPLFRRERTNDENLRALRRRRISKGWFESEERFARKVERLRAENAALRRRYRYEARLVAEGIARIEARQEAERTRQKKLEKSCEDFSKLLTFVKFVEADAFWRSEVVQIEAATSDSGAPDLTLVPRSGPFVVRFGRIEEVREKLDRLSRFYRNGLDRMGWDRYGSVDVRFAGQVVCRE